MMDRDLEGGVPAGWSSVGVMQPRGTGIRRPLSSSSHDGQTQGYSVYPPDRRVLNLFFMLFGGEWNL